MAPTESTDGAANAVAGLAQLAQLIA